MEPTQPYRPPVSRETRRLVSAGAIAIAVLWLLARLDVGDRQELSNPVPAVLTQLAGTHPFDGLARDIGALQSSVAPALAVLTLTTDGSSHRAPALRIRDDLAVFWRPTPAASVVPTEAALVAQDGASGLAVVRLTSGDAPAVTPWAPQTLTEPRYLVAVSASRRGLSLQPLFISTLEPVDNPRWTTPVWSVAGQPLTPGTFLFTTGARFAGLVVHDPTGTRIVPADTLLADAERLLYAPQRERPGTSGLEVQTLTPPVAALSGATSGAVITWVSPAVASSTGLRPGDVIEGVDDRPVSTADDWHVRASRLSAGETVQLRVRTSQGVRAVALVAGDAPPAVATRAAIGVALRRHRDGSEVTGVEAASLAARAGLTVGDVITRIAAVDAPAPAQVTRALLMRGTSGVLVAVTRGRTHLVLVVEP